MRALLGRMLPALIGALAAALAAGEKARAADPPPPAAASSGTFAQGEPDYVLPQAPPGSAEFSADSLDYLQAESSFPAKGTPPKGARLNLSGHVVLKESTWTMRSGRLEMDLDGRRARADGGVEMDDGENVLYGQSGDFDLETREGKLSLARAGFPPWRIQAAEASVDKEGRSLFRRAHFTSCDDAAEHYHLLSSAVRVVPKKYLYAANVRFYIGHTPVFYSPFLWKSLRSRRLLRARVSPGYDKRNGIYGRSTMLYSFSPALYGRLFLDYYGAQGPAFGSELQHRVSEDVRGVLYGYRVREKHSGRERWALLGDEYATLGSSYAFQGRLQAQSDADFNNHYSRTNAFRVTQELVNGAALVRRTSLGTTRLSYSRKDTQDPAQARFIRRSESMPRLEFQTAPLSLRRSPWLSTFRLFADNHFEEELGFLQRAAGAGVEATRNVSLWRGASLTPRLAFSETYQSRWDTLTSFDSTRTYQDTFTGRYEGGGNLRVNTPVGYWDGGYEFIRRLKPDTFQDAAGALDHGIERHLVSLQDTLLPRPGVVMRLGSGYDFRRYRDRELGFRRRVQPFLADFTFLPGRSWQFSLRDEYQLDEGNRAFLAQADWGDREGIFTSLGITQTLDHPGDTLAGGEFGWGPTHGLWRFGGALRTLVSSDPGARVRTAQFFEKEAWVSRDLHDFHVKGLFRSRPGGVFEVTFRVELRGGDDKERKIVRKDWESEWFPWRRKEKPE